MTYSVPHLLVYISGHGFGHVAQVAPVLNQLRERYSAIQLTVCSSVPRLHLQSRIAEPFTHIHHAADFGMHMASALDVLPQASLQAYQAFHQNWPEKVALEAAHIAEIASDFVLTNVAYLPLAAAQQAGIASAAMCSLNWLDIFSHYCGAMLGAKKVQEEMLSAYACADRFLRVTPGMDMPYFDNMQAIGAIAKIGENQRERLNRQLKLAADEKLVLISLGGIATRLPMERWPTIPGIRWLVQADWQIQRPDVVVLESLAMGFTDVLASCDALLCKPGYGSFAEAACNGVPVLYVSRGDWPEEPYLIAWQQAHSLCNGISRTQSETGEFSEHLHTLLAAPRPQPVAPTGITQAADYLASRLF